MNSSEIYITPVTLSETELLSELATATFINTYSDYNTPENMEKYISTYFNTTLLQIELQHPNIHYFFAKQEDEIIGYLKLNENEAQTETKFPEALEIERIYISPQKQGNGYGAVLLLKAIEVARNRKRSHIWLGVWDQNEKAIGFYEKNGFYKDGIHPFVLGDEPQRDYIMKLDL